MSLESLHDLFVLELRDVYDAEQQLIQSMPLMAQAVKASSLRGTFEMHLKETREQLKRLDQLFTALNEKPEGKTCRAMQGLLAELREVLDEDADPDVLDAAVIVAAQKVEHFEIAAYGSLAAFATELGYKEAAQLLRQTLKEELNTDEKLTREAEQRVNARAGVASEARL